jgi:hypothetical protein
MKVKVGKTRAISSGLKPQEGWDKEIRISLTARDLL